MRRIVLLVCSWAVVAAGCGPVGKAPTAQGDAKGSGGGKFTVTVQNGQDSPSLAIKGGRVTSADLTIDCGVGVATQKCSAEFDFGTTVVLTATSIAPDLFLGWAGDCGGEGECRLSGNADKYVLAMFGAERTGHPNWSSWELHARAYRDFVAQAPGALQCTQCHGPTLEGSGIALSCSLCHDLPGSATRQLVSRYFATDPTALAIVAGTAFDMRDPGFLVGGNQQRASYAYKVLSALNMLGYETRDGFSPSGEQHVRALARFQRTRAFAESPLLTSDVLLDMDRLLAERESIFTPRGERFVAYAHMQPTAPNMATVPFVAMLYSYPIEVLPTAYHMNEWQMAQCIAGQCVGSIHDATGAEWTQFPIDLGQDYRVAAAYYDPFVATGWLPSAAVAAHTVLHEYAHQLDGAFLYHPIAAEPHFGLVNTLPFYSVSVDTAGFTSNVMPYCVTLRTHAQADYISYYAFGMSTAYRDSSGCAAGLESGSGSAEDFAEGFATYVMAGRRFRAAAQSNAALAQKYALLRDTVFGGIEYDTDTSLGFPSADCASRELYFGCNQDAVWSGEFPTLPFAPARTLEVVSRTASGGLTAAAARNSQPSVSETGRYVAFLSTATNLVAGDTNGVEDVFVRDRLLGTTTRLSIATDGTQANGPSLNPRISGDGRFVAFTSSATNLVSGDTNGFDDVFLHDRVMHTTVRVSVASDGAQANGPSGTPAISWNGRVVVFASTATNLVATYTPTRSIFVRDYVSGTTERVASDLDADSYAAVSGDGRFVAYTTDEVRLLDRATGTSTVASVGASGSPAAPRSSTWPAVSFDGRFVVFVSSDATLVAADTNGARDVFVRDTRLGTTVCASGASDGSPADGAVSPYPPSLSSDGRFVGFTSGATNLFDGDANVAVDAFVHDIASGTTARVATPPIYTSDRGAGGTGVSGDGRVVVFETGTRIVDADTNGGYDVYGGPNPLYPR